MAATIRDPGRSAPPTAAETKRMAWLDALRGIAAFFVVLEHSFDPILPELRRSVSPWFNLGKFGVLLFFLISGYVVPASLERRGDLRAFWIGRGFRLYPLFAIAAAGALLLIPAGFGSVPAPLADPPGTANLAHLPMLNALTGVPSLVNVFWTLSYEMVFYLLVTALYVFGLHRHSAGISLTCILVAVALGMVLTPAWLTSQASDLTVI